MCSNMQELKQLVASNRKKRAFQHYELKQSARYLSTIYRKRVQTGKNIPKI